MLRIILTILWGGSWDYRHVIQTSRNPSNPKDWCPAPKFPDENNYYLHNNSRFYTTWESNFSCWFEGRGICLNCKLCRISRYRDKSKTWISRSFRGENRQFRGRNFEFRGHFAAKFIEFRDNFAVEFTNFMWSYQMIEIGKNSIKSMDINS